MLSRIAPLVACSGLLIAGCGAAKFTSVVTNTPAVVTPIWVGSWGDAIVNNDSTAGNKGGTSKSYRFLVYPTLGGTKERVRFSNYYGTTPITIGTAHLSVGQDGSPAVDPTHDVALQFSGQPSVTLAPGQVITSDPVAMSFSFGQFLAITVFLPGTFGPIAHHNSLFMTNYATVDGAGDATQDTAGTSFTTTTGEWLLINGVDVYGPYQGTLALFGSSTTDGFHSDFSSNQAYPVPNAPVPGQHTDRLSDWMARRLNTAGYQIGVVNLGISGDTVTADSSNASSNIQNANQRIGHDVLTLPSLLAMVTYFGAIDLRSADCHSASAIESATQQLVATAAAANVPVILSTLPPSAFCTNATQPSYGPSPNAADPYAGGVNPGPANGAEVQRIAFDQWVRTTGASLPGVAGVADFDNALKDPALLSFLLPQYNSGDNYHPTGLGYGAEANAIPLSVLPAPPK